MAARPAPHDVILRKKSGNPSTYQLGTLSAPGLFTLPVRDIAVSLAVALATRQHVRAWMANGYEDFVLLDTCEEGDVTSPRFS